MGHGESNGKGATRVLGKVVTMVITHKSHGEKVSVQWVITRLTNHLLCTLPR